MRVALIGWEIDDEVAAALAGLDVELVAFTRGVPGQDEHEDRGGWTIERRSQAVGAGSVTESATFREAVVGRAAANQPFDVVHALDSMSRTTAAGLAERSPACVRVTSLTLADVCPELDRPERFDADRWVADHPWILERWSMQHDGDPGGVAHVPSRSLADSPARSERATPLLAIWLPRQADQEFDPIGVTRALVEVAAEVPGFTAIVLGAGPGAHALRNQLAGRRLLERPMSEVVDASPAQWSAWLASATVVGLATERPAEDPAAWAAWSYGVLVVGLEAGNAGGLANALRATLSGQGPSARLLKAGAAIAGQQLSPTGVAAGWLRVYVDALTRPATEPETRPEPAPNSATLVAGERTRLVLVATGTREVYAAWHLRPDDRALALQWLGPKSAYATVTLRFYDVTDILFDGTNAHYVWDVDLAPGEHFRDPDQRCWAFTGGEPWHAHASWAFLPLAHAGPTHLPRESETTNPATQWLRALPRR